jgi:hypothetical protein
MALLFVITPSDQFNPKTICRARRETISSNQHSWN